MFRGRDNETYSSSSTSSFSTQEYYAKQRCIIKEEKSPRILLLQFLMKIKLTMPVPVILLATVFYLRNQSIRHLFFIVAASLRRAGMGFL